MTSATEVAFLRDPPRPPSRPRFVVTRAGIRASAAMRDEQQRIAGIVRAARIRLMPQTEAAERLNETSADVSKWERGERPIPRVVRQRMAALYRIDPALINAEPDVELSAEEVAFIVDCRALLVGGEREDLSQGASLSGPNDDGRVASPPGSRKSSRHAVSPAAAASIRSRGPRNPSSQQGDTAMPEQAEHPIRLRKLNNQHRLKMATLAAEKFRCGELRAAEAAAKDDLTRLLYRDATSIPKRELEVLRKHRFTITVEGFRLPGDIGFRETGERTFELPNGTKVVRQGGDTKIVSGPSDDEHELPSFSTWREAINATAERCSGGQYRAKAMRVALPKRVELPCGDRPYIEDYELMRVDNDTRGKVSCSHARSEFITDDVVRAIIAYFRAADARIREERRLIVAAVQVIASCSVYAQALDFWPEVAEIEESLFGKPIIPNAYSVVTLSDEDKAALCANMASRGVESPVCQRAA